METGLIADYERARRQENLDRAVAAEREAADLRARLAAAQAREARLVVALRECEGIFLHYAKLHAAKTPPDQAKFATNDAHACMCRAALTANGAALAAAIDAVVRLGSVGVPPPLAEALAALAAEWRGA